MWDMRNTSSPIELIEKAMDVFSLQITRSHLFMGCRNHSIVPVGLKGSNFLIDNVQTPLKAPHLDVVTSFTTLLDQKILISASRDKNLRAWHTTEDGSLSQLHNLSRDKVHQDHINCI